MLCSHPLDCVHLFVCLSVPSDLSGNSGMESHLKCEFPKMCKLAFHFHNKRANCQSREAKNAPYADQRISVMLHRATASRVSHRGCLSYVCCDARCLLQQQLHLQIRHNNAMATVSALRLSSVEIHGVDTSPTSVTANHSSWNEINYSTTTQVSTDNGHARRVYSHTHSPGIICLLLLS